MKKAPRRVRSTKPAASSEDDDFLSEYDFSGGVRGKYANRFAAEAHFVLPLDLAAEFPNSKAVEKALRAYLKSKPGRRSA
jgi:hypothetical protein